MTFLDAIVFVWIAIVAGATYIGLPLLVRHLCAPHARPGAVGLIAGLLLTTSASVAVLSAVALVNPITVVAIHVAWAATVFVWSYRSFGGATERLLRSAAELDEADRETRLAAVRAALRRIESAIADAASGITRSQIAAFGLIGSTLLVARVLPALSEARLFHPLAYDQLYLIRRILSGTLTNGIAPPFAGWAAAVVTLCSVDAAYVMRFLPALLACALTAAVMWASRRISGRSDVAIVAAFVWLLAGSAFAESSPWAVVLARQHGALGEYLAASVVLLLLGSTSDEHVSRRTPIAAVMLLCPAMSPVAAAATAPPRIRLGITALAWLAMAGAGLNPNAPAVLRAVATTMPVAIALGCAAMYHALQMTRRLPDPSVVGAWGLLAMLAGSGVAPPRVVIEPDSVARQALRIVRDAPAGPWTIVGRSMPLLRGYPRVEHEASAAFVACADDAAPADACRRARETPTFVFVQKRPFDAVEADTEQMGLFAAERVVHATPGARIYDDDDTLRVYELPAQPLVYRMARQ